MHVGVIGGGLMGTSLAYFLARAGQQVTLIEQNAELGGLSSTVQFDDGLTIPRYHHYLLPSEAQSLDVIDQLDLRHSVRFRAMQSGVITNGDFSPMQSVWDLLHFDAIRLRDRLRLGYTLLRARLSNDWQALDGISAEEWLVRVGGRSNFEEIWAPLLDAKFDYEYRDVPATFIWGWLRRMFHQQSGASMRASIGHLDGGFRTLIDAMAVSIVGSGGTIRTQTRVREIDLTQAHVRQVRTQTGILHFDAVMAAIPAPEFNRLLLSAEGSYLKSLSDARYLGLICPALVVERPLSDYWTLVLTDPSSPFSSIVEMPHPTQPELSVVYLPKYTSPNSDWMGVPDEDIRDAWMLRLRQIFPTLKPEQILHFVVNRSRYVEPIHFLNSSTNLLPIRTPWEGLYLANSSQVYPQLPTCSAIINHAQMVALSLIQQGQAQMLIRTAA